MSKGQEGEVPSWKKDMIKRETEKAGGMMTNIESSSSITRENVIRKLIEENGYDEALVKEFLSSASLVTKTRKARGIEVGVRGYGGKVVAKDSIVEVYEFSFTARGHRVIFESFVPSPYPYPQFGGIPICGLTVDGMKVDPGSEDAEKILNKYQNLRHAWSRLRDLSDKTLTNYEIGMELEAVRDILE